MKILVVEDEIQLARLFGDSLDPVTGERLGRPAGWCATSPPTSTCRSR
jgi:hypothetical protein